MIPVLTPSQMRAVDAAAPEPVAELIARAGWAVASEARDLLGGTYGRRVVVFAGPGSNGEDGRVAARLLRRWGTRVVVVDARSAFDVDRDGEDPAMLAEVRRSDLVIDAGFGTGLRSAVRSPDVGSVPVLAVDVPSGLDAATGRSWGRPLAAVRTVTFAAEKPGLLLGDGPDLVGTVVLADIGLDAGAAAEIWRVTADDVAEDWPRRGRSDHKWTHAVLCVGGEEGMAGGLRLCATAAFAAGAGHVTVARPGRALVEPTEAVNVRLDGDPAGSGWADAVSGVLDRVGALAIGPGLSPSAAAQVRAVVGACARPMVIDAGALDAIGSPEGRQLLVGRARVRPDLPLPVLTPHDGEYGTLMGERPGEDRIEATLRAAEHYQAVVLLKGPATVVAHPKGQVLVAAEGDERLASAGTGDVLTGLIAAALASGLPPAKAAAFAAALHGCAARLGPRRGFTASMLPDLVRRWRDDGPAPSTFEPGER